MWSNSKINLTPKREKVVESVRRPEGLKYNVIHVIKNGLIWVFIVHGIFFVFMFDRCYMSYQ